MVNPEIFREYDIRGMAERDLTAPVVETLGKTFASYVRSKGVVKVTVGYDARLSSPRLRDALVRGLAEAGMRVMDLGLCPTPALYFSLYHLEPGAGVMITGSHNPPEFNGFKLCVGKDTIYGEDIQRLRHLMEESKSEKSEVLGQVTRHPIIPDYVNCLKKQFLDHSQIPLKVVLDAGNGTAGLAAPEIIREMGCEVMELYSEPDGRFPNHHPDPTIPGNLTALINTVKAQKADTGIAFDGDADRIGVVDGEGNILWGDQLMVIFSRDILQNRPGATFVSEVKCSQTMYDDIRKHGGNAVMWKTGHSLIKAKMKEVGAALAGEMSGHLFFADRYFGYDDAIYAACRLVEIMKNLKKSGKTAGASPGIFRTLLNGMPKTFNTPEIRIECSDGIKFHVVDRMKDAFSHGKGLSLKPKDVITVDGIRAVFEKGWGLIRASNTQPVLVMRFEAQDSATLNTIQTMMEGKVKEAIAELAP